MIPAPLRIGLASIIRLGAWRSSGLLSSHSNQSAIWHATCNFNEECFRVVLVRQPVTQKMKAPLVLMIAEKLLFSRK